MINRDLAVIILAAGKGKRMNNSEVPKVMTLLQNKPLVEYVLEQVVKLSPKLIYLVVGHQKEKIIQYFDKSNYNIIYAVQLEQLGTGHAVAQTKNYLLDFEGLVLILAGDVPLIRYKTLQNLINNHIQNGAVATDLTALADNPFGYGRIIRDENNNFIKIVEQKDATDKEKEIKEINSGIFCIEAKELFPALDSLKNNNAQGEYYLTDIIEYFIKNNKKVNAFCGSTFEELQGINTYEELISVENLIKNTK